MMETQEVDYFPPAAFHNRSLDGTMKDRDNPVGYIHFQGREEPIYKEKTNIGRDTLSDIIIDEPQISRLHATIKVNQKKNLIFICVYGKGNFLNGDELDPELFYQVNDNAEVDFRSLKFIYKLNKRPETEAPPDFEAAVDESEKPSFLEDKENKNGIQGEGSEADQQEPEVEPEEEQVDEDECTQFEDDFRAGTPDVQSSPPAEMQADDFTPSDNPFIEDTQDTPIMPPSRSGFRLQRLPSFETQEQEVSEMETQPSDIDLRPLAEKIVEAKNDEIDKRKNNDKSTNGNISRDDLEEQTRIPDETQASTLELRVSLDETQPSLKTNTNVESQNESLKEPFLLTNTIINVAESQDDSQMKPFLLTNTVINVAESQDESQKEPFLLTNTIINVAESQDDSPRERPHTSSSVRKTLSFEETRGSIKAKEDDTKIASEVPIGSQSRVDKSRTAEVALEMETQVSPLVQRRAPRLLSLSEIEAVQQCSPNLMPASSTPQSANKVLDESISADKEDPVNVIDESSVLEESSDGIIEASDDEEKSNSYFFMKDTQDRSKEESNINISTDEVQESQERDVWQDSSDNNTTAVEVVKKMKCSLQEKNVDIDQAELQQNDSTDHVTLPADKVKDTHPCVVEASSPSVTVNENKQTQELSACSSETTVTNKKHPKMKSRLSFRKSVSPDKQLTKSISNGSIATLSQEDTTSSPSSFADNTRSNNGQLEDTAKYDSTENHTEKCAEVQSEAVKDVPQALPSTTYVTKNSVGSPASALEDLQMHFKPKISKRSLKPKSDSTPNRQKLSLSFRERSPSPEISIAEEVKMSPRMAKIAAVVKLDSSSPKSTPKVKQINKIEEAKSSENDEKCDETDIGELKGKQQVKKPQEVSEQENNTEIEIALTEQDQTTEGTSVRRNVRRTRKQKLEVTPLHNETSEEIVLNQEQLDSTMENETEVMPKEAKKRGRGRPTKMQKQAVPKSDEEPSNSKKRAAPKSEVVPDTEPPKKSPRKSAEATLETSANALPEEQGSRPRRRRTMNRKLQEFVCEGQDEKAKNKRTAQKNETVDSSNSSPEKKARTTQNVPPKPSTRNSRRKNVSPVIQDISEPKVDEQVEEISVANEPPRESLNQPASRSRRARKTVDPKEPKILAPEEPVKKRGAKFQEIQKVEKQTDVPSQKRTRLSRKDSFAKQVEMKGRQNSASSSVASSSDSQSRTRTQIYVFFSGFEGPMKKEKELIAKLGGHTKEEVPDVKHKGEEFVLVVNGAFKRTLKVLDIMGFGSPIVSQEWLKACTKACSFVDAWDYILRDEAAEKKFGFNLQECLTKAKEHHDLFSQWSLYFTPNVVPKGAHLKKCVDALGGKYIASKPKKWPAQNLMIISCEEDKSIYQSIMKQTKPRKDVVVFVTVQGFFECLQQQKIVALDKFALNC